MILAVRTVLVLAVVLLVEVLGVLPASAHTDLVAASPAAGDRVAGGVRDLTLTFDSTLVPVGAQVVVTGKDGASYAGPAAVGGSRVRVPLTGLSEPGRYTVAYRVVGSDGHPVTGRYRFTVVATAAVASGTRVASDKGSDAGVAERVEAAPPARPAGARWLVGGLGAVVLAALLLSAANRPRLDQEAAR
jgi:methionine-rich copper-binding protein CopC